MLRPLFTTRFTWAAIGLAVLFEPSVRLHATATRTDEPERDAPKSVESCFLLYELGVGELRRNPSAACRTRITPASTFKVPHAVAALDAGVVTPDEVFRYDGTGDWPASARRDHTLASALRHSVLWYFMRLAQRLGPEREHAYLEKFAFGNMDSSSAPTRFWVGGSLQVTPEEQLAFWLKLYENELPVAASAASTVRHMLIQPRGVVINAAGEHPFDAPWPAGTIVSTKTGSAADRSGRGTRWLIGHIDKSGRQFIFVSCVIGPRDLAANAAIDLAARALREAQVL
jgi:beta-lactamase class D